VDTLTDLPLNSFLLLSLDVLTVLSLDSLIGLAGFAHRTLTRFSLTGVSPDSLARLSGHIPGLATFSCWIGRILRGVSPDSHVGIGWIRSRLTPHSCTDLSLHYLVRCSYQLLVRFSRRILTQNCLWIRSLDSRWGLLMGYTRLMLFIYCTVYKRCIPSYNRHVEVCTAQYRLSTWSVDAASGVAFECKCYVESIIRSPYYVAREITKVLGVDIRYLA
jgi:hypothetical protein